VTFDADPFDALRSYLPPRPEQAPSAADAIPFSGGAVAYLGYELGSFIEDLELRAADDIGLPDMYALFVDQLVSFDLKTGRVRVHGLGFAADHVTASERARQAVDAVARRLTEPDSQQRRTATGSCSRARATGFDATAHAKAVDAAKQEIAAGNVYQVCLTHRVERDCATDPWRLYCELRDSNPAPFASYLELPEVTIVSSSPERFLHLSANRMVTSRPIKGTRPRGGDPGEDALLQASLANSAKDRAENLMIVDLVRNDLGRVCEIGSVDVPRLMTIESYASVFQMVSTVTGRLRSDCDAIDAIRAAFPPGSMTGAPKIAAMKIIDRLEPVRRGIYSGALGYFDVRGEIDLCVVIRAVLVLGSCAYVQSGGGIVADSDPDAEYRETLDKARPLLAALDRMTR